MQVPGVITQTLTQTLVRLNEFGRESVRSGVIASGQTDSGSTPTSRLRAGNVLAKRTSTGKYVLSTDANADRATPASITSSGRSNGNGVIKLVGSNGTISVTTTTGSGTAANNVTDLNADAAFSAHYVASVSGSEVKIESRRIGADEWFYVHSDTMDTAGFAEGETSAVRGQDPDIVVLGAPVDLKDANGSNVDAIGELWPKGCFRAAGLFNMTEEARSVLLRKGSEIR